LSVAGGAVVATAGRAAASPPPVVCNSLTGTDADGGGSFTGILKGCTTPGFAGLKGDVSAGFDVTGRPTPFSVFWPKLGASSLGNWTVFQASGNPCPPTPVLDVLFNMTITIGNGPFAGTSGTGSFCLDYTTYSVTSVGPVSL
jgi:hypothetical protein